MIKFPWKIKNKPLTSAEEKLEEIKTLLFPPLEVQQEVGSDGKIIKFHIDYSVDSNIDAALMDLQDGHNDPVVHSTLNKAVGRLNRARKILEAYAVLDKEAKYIIVDDGKDIDVEARED